MTDSIFFDTTTNTTLCVPSNGGPIDPAGYRSPKESKKFSEDFYSQFEPFKVGPFEHANASTDLDAEITRELTSILMQEAKEAIMRIEPHARFDSRGYVRYGYAYGSTSNDPKSLTRKGMESVRRKSKLQPREKSSN